MPSNSLKSMVLRVWIMLLLLVRIQAYSYERISSCYNPAWRGGKNPESDKQWYPSYCSEPSGIFSPFPVIQGKAMNVTCSMESVGGIELFTKAKYFDGLNGEDVTITEITKITIQERNLKATIRKNYWEDDLASFEPNYRNDKRRTFLRQGLEDEAEFSILKEDQLQVKNWAPVGISVKVFKATCAFNKEYICEIVYKIKTKISHREHNAHKRFNAFPDMADCLFTCPKGYEQQGDACYMIPDGAHPYLNWNDASAYCENHDGFLAQPYNAQQLSWVKKVIGKYIKKGLNIDVRYDLSLPEDNTDSPIRGRSMISRRCHVWLGARADTPGGIWKWYDYTTNGGKASGSKLSKSVWYAWGSEQPSTPENSLENRDELCLEYWNVDDTRVSPWNNNDCKRRQRFICQSSVSVPLHNPDAKRDSLYVEAIMSVQTGSHIFACVLDNPQRVPIRRPELRIRRKKAKEPSFTGDPLVLQFLNDDMTPSGGGTLDPKVSGVKYTIILPMYVVTVNQKTSVHEGTEYMCELAYRVAGDNKLHKTTASKVLVLVHRTAVARAHSSTMDMTIFVLSGLISLTVILVV